ncbi:MAG: Ig-like domain-containing protein, partial [Bacteroidota bacterium]
LDVAFAVDEVRVASEQEVQLEYAITPANATRNNVIFYSSDPEVVTIDKFGVLHAKKAGRATVSIYSWEDARPLAANAEETYLRTGVSDQVAVEVFSE